MCTSTLSSAVVAEQTTTLIIHIQFSLFSIVQYHKLKMCLRALESVHIDIPDPEAELVMCNGEMSIHP